MQFFLKTFIVIFTVILLAAINLLDISAYAFVEEKCQVIQVKTCVDSALRVIDGFETTNVCWNLEEKFLCVSKEKNHCAALESNRGCDETSANCLEPGRLEFCKNLKKTFSCGKVLDQLDTTNENIKHIDTEFHIKRDEKDLSNCSAEEINKHCEVVEEKCIEPEETRNINGKEIHKDCWKWDRKYVCRTDTFIDECKQMPENCKKIGEPICIHFSKISATTSCDHFETKYQCNETKTIKKECLAKEFCLGGICDKSTRSQHNDFGSSISYLSILAQMKSNELEGCRCPNGKDTCEAAEIDPANCKFFTGGAKQCKRTTGELNCCDDRGFLRAAWKCSQGEKDLLIQRKTGLCHPVGSWRGKKWKRLTKYQSYCCFKSKLSKIIQVQGRQQLGVSWGNHKAPDCRSLTLEEIRRIDFSKIDFSELYADIVDKVSTNLNAASEKISQKMNEFKDGNKAINNKATSDMINKKINQFYGGKK